MKQVNKVNITGWNPLEVLEYANNKPKTAKYIAKTLIGFVTPKSGADQFWLSSEVSLLTGLMLSHKNLAEVCDTAAEISRLGDKFDKRSLPDLPQLRTFFGMSENMRFYVAEDIILKLKKLGAEKLTNDDIHIKDFGSVKIVGKNKLIVKLARKMNEAKIWTK